MSSTTKKLKDKKCKFCDNIFAPDKPLQSVCSMNCAFNRSYELNKKKKERAKANETKSMKQALMTKNELIKLAQIVFNRYIRLRDKDEPCISCGTTKPVKYDAGHFYPTTYSFLRFNEDNVHKQCSNDCNKFKSGNLLEYRPRLIEKIGESRVRWLDENRHKRLELTNDEIRELIKEYKNKINQLNN